MIPKVDTYFSDALSKYVDVVTSSIGTQNERYIIDEALGNMEPNTLDKFKKAFGQSKKKIDITYAFPKQKEQVDARFVIYRGKLKEDQGSIGSIEGIGAEARPANGENIATEYLPVKKDDSGYFIELSNPIYDLIDIDEIASLDGYVDYETDDPDPKRINLLDSIGIMLGKHLTVHYNIQDTGDRKDYGGTALGFTAKDSIVVQAVSNNEDTVRCLDSILKYVLVIMRSSGRESKYYQIAHIESDGLQFADNMDIDNPVFVIPTVVTYTVSYAVRNDSRAVFERILVNGKDK